MRDRAVEIEIAMLAVVVVAAAVSAIQPHSFAVWMTEIFWVAGLLAVLLSTRRMFRFSLAAYSCFFAWMMLQTVGAHYTFELVPMDWLKEPLGLVRNPYDRIAHFTVGWFAFPFAELFLRKGWVRSAALAAFFAVMTVVAMAGLWELVEWQYAVIEGGDAGAAFLGSQGDVWDAQKDILCDTLGAICSSGLFLWCDRRDPLYWAYKFPDGTAVLNPENDAPTAMWLSVRAKENIRIFAWIIMLVFGMGMIGGGIKGAVSVLFRDGIFSRWWIGALIAFGGLKLMQYLAFKLKASSTRKRRKKRKGNRGTKV